MADIKAKLEAVFAGGEFHVEALIALFEAVIGKILRFVAKEEGYEYTAE